jgi:hypothetical protein
MKASVGVVGVEAVSAGVWNVRVVQTPDSNALFVRMLERMPDDGEMIAPWFITDSPITCE